MAIDIPPEHRTDMTGIRILVNYVATFTCICGHILRSSELDWSDGYLLWKGQILFLVAVEVMDLTPPLSVPDLFSSERRTAA